MPGGGEQHQCGSEVVESARGSALSIDWQVAKPMVDSNKINPRNLVKNLDILNIPIGGKNILLGDGEKQPRPAERYHNEFTNRKTAQANSRLAIHLRFAC
jgi:hypothetical protein